MNPKPPSSSRNLTKREATYLYECFEDIHCYKLDENGQVIPKKQCPGWDWNLQHIDENDKPVQGGCKYKETHKLCKCLQIAADGHYIIEIRPRNEEDDERDRKTERDTLLQERNRLKLIKDQLDEQMLALDNKLRNI